MSVWYTVAELNESYSECVNGCMNAARCKCGLIHVVLELAYHFFIFGNDLSSYHLEALQI